MSAGQVFDTLVVGGGFYGATIAAYLARQPGAGRVLLVEGESRLMQRASYRNQARIHNGYHYPRSFTTAYRSRVNLPRFVRDWPSSVKSDFEKLYAIARRNSKVSASQFLRFCNEIGAEIAPAATKYKKLFQPHLIEEVFSVREYAFDTEKLAQQAHSELSASGVRMLFNTRVEEVTRSGEKGLLVSLREENGLSSNIECKHVFNCTYSGINQLGGSFTGVKTGIKQEITEMALMRVPPELRDVGITVMDGPFFSLMPFPARVLHTLSHVRYTPHMHWQDTKELNPYRKLDAYEKDSRTERMVRDVARYLPLIGEAEHVDSLFEIKTVLQKSETDDGRPILFERHEDMPGCYSILGGKIDNIYDVLEKLDSEFLPGLLHQC